MLVTLVWNKTLERWVMKDKRGYNIYEFPDCGNMNLAFEGLNKGVENNYDFTQVKKTSIKSIG
jgi:hypothetical protein